MPQYRVVDDCYVPVGAGTRFKYAGQIVTLDAADAAKLRGYVEPDNGRAPRPAATTRATPGKTADMVVADLNLKLADASAPPTDDDDGDE